LNIETNKKAILCLPTENSDIVFKDSNSTTLTYLNNLLDFLEIPNKNLLSRIDITSDEIVKGSSIANKYKNKKYSVIISKNVMETFKTSNFLKKNKLKTNLVIISKTRINVSDKLLDSYKDHTYLDLLAFQIEATTISCLKSELYDKVISNLRINLSLFATWKEATFLLFDISEPKIND
jgi:hypothetical protein